MRFSSFFRRKIHNQQHWLDMNKKSQNGYNANKLHPINGVPQNNRRITTRSAVPLRKSVGVLY